MSINWTDKIGEKIIKSVEVNIGDTKKIIHNLEDGKKVEFFYKADKCLDIQYIDEKHEREFKDMLKELRGHR